ncbi:MAG: sulfatase-like hydrolase/transferase [Tissierellales bacterium]
MNIIRKHRIQILESSILLVLFLIKVLVYNKLIENGNVSIKISFISLAYFLLVIALANLLSVKRRGIVFFLAYSAISLVMFADAAYFKYFNQLTSVVVLKQFSQLTTVGESIAYILEPINFLLVADILPLIFYYVFIHKNRFSNVKNPLDKKQSIGFTVVALAIVILSVASVNTFGDNINLYKQEFFTYHIADIYNTFFSTYEAEDIDQLLKESIEKISNKEKNLFGLAKGKNVITIQVEGLQNFVINRDYNGEEITPNLNKLIKENSIYFDRYYQQLGRGNTSDAEFVSHNSLYPAMDGQSYLMYYDNTYYGLPWILKDKGYSTAAFHGYKAAFWSRDKAYPYQGFDKFYSGDAHYKINEPVIGLGINDSEFYTQSIDFIKSMQEPYYAFLVTLSSHHPFDMPQIYKNIIIEEKHEGTLFGNYIQSINYADAALGEFIEHLKEEGLYENTIINIYGDHFGLSSIDEENIKNMTEYLGYEYDFDEMLKVPLIVHLPDSGISQKISITGGQMDFLPTVLNLLGIENKKGIMLGQDLINAVEGFVAQQTYMLKGSYIKDDFVFSMSRDGIFKNSRAWNINTRQPVELESCREDYERAIKEINESNNILRNDLLKKYFPNRRQESSEEGPSRKNISPEKQIFYAGTEEAIYKGYENGYKFIEIDFQWTNGENLVFTYLTQMSLEDLGEWLEAHRDVYIVTDIKKENVRALEYIKEKHPELMSQIVAQINKMDEFISLQGLGYTNIILVLDESGYPDEEIIDFVKRHEIFAITMSGERAQTQLPNKLKQENIFVYTQIINEPELKKELEANGVDGFYIDELLP